MRRRKQVIAPEAELPIVRRLAQLIAGGLTTEQAAARIGMEPAQADKLLAKPANRREVEAAKAEFIERALAAIAAGERGWQGAAWVLERCYREQFGRQAEVEVNTAIAVGFTLDDIKVLAEARKERDRELLGEGQGGRHLPA